jgi:hypothetical protein
MLSRVCALALPVVCAALWLCGGPAGSRALAQKGLPASETDLNKFETQDNRTAWNTLLRGEREPDPKAEADTKLLEMAGRYYVYRLTLITKQKKLHEVVDELKSVMTQLKADEKRKLTLELFSKEAVKCLQEVLAMDMKQYRAPVVNAGLMLEPLGRSGQPEVGDFLAGLVKDGKRHEVIKLFAFKGLREYFHARPPKVEYTSLDPDRQPEIARVEPVLDFVLRPPAMAPANAEEKAACQFVRREAIRALAETRVPVIPLRNKAVKAPIAYALLRVLAGGKDGLTPAPSLSEKLEAAIGVCQMKSDPAVSPQYQPDLGVALVGKTLFEFIQRYKADQPYFPAKGVPGKVPELPWKAYAERLRQALKEFHDNLPAANAAARKRVQSLQATTNDLFNLINRHKAIVDEFRPMQAVVQEMPHPPAVYEGVKDFQIDVGEWLLEG